jgi:hypothetical protein
LQRVIEKFVKKGLARATPQSRIVRRNRDGGIIMEIPDFNDGTILNCYPASFELWRNEKSGFNQQKRDE